MHLTWRFSGTCPLNLALALKRSDRRRANSKTAMRSRYCLLFTTFPTFLNQIYFHEQHSSPKTLRTRGRLNPTSLLKKDQESPGAYLAAIAGYQNGSSLFNSSTISRVAESQSLGIGRRAWAISKNRSSSLSSPRESIAAKSSIRPRAKYNRVLKLRFSVASDASKVSTR